MKATEILNLLDITDDLKEQLLEDGFIETTKDVLDNLDEDTLDGDLVESLELADNGYAVTDIHNNVIYVIDTNFSEHRIYTHN